MNDITEPLTRRKRKALNAATFIARYRAQADVEAERGNLHKAEKLRAKCVYWAERFHRLSR